MTVDMLLLKATSWLLTYAVHSSLLIAIVWGLIRSFTFSLSAQELLWKAAMFGGIVTGGMHVATGGGVGLSYALGQASEPVRAEAKFAPIEIGTAELSLAAIPAESGLPSDPALGGSAAPEGFSTTPAPTTAVTQPQAASATVNFTWLTWPTAVGLFWLGGLMVAAIRFLRARIHLAKLLGDRHPVGDPFLLEELRELRKTAGITYEVGLSWSTRLVAPLALRREICLPRRALTDLDPALLTGMLAHELAHVARQDSTWLHLSFALRLAMFFQPLNRLAYTRIQELAEYLCDEWAVRHTGRRRAVAECLAEVAQWIDRTGRPIPLPSMAYDGSNLVHRVERILSGREDHQMFPRSIKVLTLAGAVALFGAAAPGFAPPREVAAGASSEETATLVDTTGVELDITRPAVNEPVASVPTRSMPESSTPTTPPETSSSTPIVPATPSLASNRTPRLTPSTLGLENAQAKRDTADPRVVASLLIVLRDEDPDVRREAAEALGRLRATTAVPNLITALEDEATPVRAYAAWALGQIKDIRSLDAGLDAMVQDDSARVRRAAASAVRNILSERDRSTLDVAGIGARFVRLLSDDEAELRETAISVLTDLRLSQYGTRIAPLMADPIPAVRRRAASALGRFQTPEGLAPLTRALADSSSSVRRAVLSAMARYQTPASAAAIRRALTDESEDVRESAARLVGQGKDSTAIDALVIAANDPVRDVRVAALRALRELRMPEALPAYTRALGDVNQTVRASGAAGLGAMRDPVALPALNRAARDSSANVREVAIRSIHRIGDTTATSTLIRALSDPEPDVRERAASALGDIRTTRAIASLGAVIRDSISDVRQQVVRALAKYNDPSTYSAFVAALSDSNDDVRKSAAQALGSLRDARAVAPLTTRVRSDPNSEVRKRALRSIGAIGGDNIFAPAIAALEDGSSEVRVMAVSILGQTRDSRAVDPLMRALEDESSEVRRAATRALGRIRGR